MAAPGTGRGFDATTLTLGYGVYPDASSATVRLGFTTVSTGDVDAQMRAMVSALNDRGGVMGRRIVLARVSASSTDDPVLVAQRACAAWTQDTRVFAVIGEFGDNRTLRECLARADTPLLISRAAHVGQPTLLRLSRYLYQPDGMASDAFIRVFVDSLVQRRFFTGWDTTTGKPGTAPVRIGLLHSNDVDEAYEAVLLKRALAEHHLAITDEVTYAATVDALAAATQSAVLKFRSDGITHVLGAGVLFWKDAEAQQYRARQGIRDIDVNVPLNGSANQLRGSMGVGYTPMGDVAAGEYPGDPGPATTGCRRVMRAAGLDDTSNATMYSMATICDAINVLRDALARGGGLSSAALEEGMDNLGRFDSALTWRVRVSAGHHAGVDAARDLGYHDDCTCYRYDATPLRSA